MKAGFPVIISVGLLVVFPGTWAPAQNLVVNGDFDTDVDHWLPYSSVELVWDTDDCHFDPGSGSAIAILEGTANTGFTQCIDGIVAGEMYDLSGWANLFPGQTGGGYAGFFIWWRSGPGCTGTKTTALETPLMDSPVGWQKLAAGPEQAPDGTVGATLYVNINETISGDFSVAFDDIELRLLPFFADGFENGDFSGWTGYFP